MDSGRVAVDVIAVVAFDGINPFHLSVPCLVFGAEQPSSELPPVEVRVCTPDAAPIVTTAGFTVSTGFGLEEIADAAMVIVPSWPDPELAAPTEILTAIRTAHDRGARVVGLCLGAFVVADTGLLNGRPAATHWKWAEVFARRFPQVLLDRESLYVDDGDIVTSAGTTAAIDTCLHLLRGQHGAELANRVARRLVMPPHRAGGQAQFIEHPLPPTDSEHPLAATLHWTIEHLNEDLTVDRLAAHAAMSRRTFTRHFRKTMGTGAGDWIATQRVALAQRLLETTDLTVERIAERCGFGSAVTMREQFARTLGTTPSAYRGAFRGPEPVSGRR
ncbi:helix-turn-helix domain-containing protein [Nocardia otitidiscaviarum]|uniref:Helix-turn-helix domain-containing protein n=1 Tax=Nocardia otitidiscaviarum TaxID=1823 RepID=A0A516NFC9_9NOCA|nr:helix-turn-helix domain-containing protein [Nocardia otitidiscaviarum]